jgi:CcmD family protein
MDSRNFTYMFYGFAVAWLIPAIYLVTLMLREKRLQNELDRVKRMIGDKDGHKSTR